MLFALIPMTGIPAVAADLTLAHPNAQTSVVNLTVNYQTNPLGVDENAVRFAWKMESNIIGQEQDSYKIVVKKGSSNGTTVWDSGTVASELSTGILYSGSALELETRYYWTVAVTTKSGEYFTSEPAFFETGTDWTGAEWFVPGDGMSGTGAFALLRTEGTVDSGELVSARLYMTALGFYNAYINGQKVLTQDVNGNEVEPIFAPGWTDYRYYINYQTYDVTDYITDDDIVLGAELGRGWYMGTGISDAGNYFNIGIPDATSNATKRLAMVSKLVITYEDGSTQVIGDKRADWKSSIGAVTANDIFNGESYDARIAKTLVGWNDVGFNAVSWSNVTTAEYTGTGGAGNLLTGFINPSSQAAAYIAEGYSQNPIGAFTYDTSENLTGQQAGNQRGAVVRHPVNLSNPIALTAGDSLIVDMGQNMVGALRISVSGTEGSTVTMRHAEMLNDGSSSSDGADGTIYTAALGNAQQRDIYTLSDDAVQTYQPYFTFHGFRFVEIVASANVTILGIEGKVYTSVGEQTGFIETSDQYVNKLFNNVLWGQMGNHISIPTDCPQRAERAGWTGDAQVFSKTGLYNFDIRAFSDSYIDNMESYAANNNGRYIVVLPISTGFANRVSSGWSDAAVTIPWALYQQTGDIYLLERSYERMEVYMDLVFPNGGYGNDRFGDHLAFEGASTQFMNQIYRIYTSQIMEEISTILGKETQAQKYRDRIGVLKAEFIEAPTLGTNGQPSTSRGGFVFDTSGTHSQTGFQYNPGDLMSYGAIMSGTTGINSQTAFIWALKLGLWKDEAHR